MSNWQKNAFVSFIIGERNFDDEDSHKPDDLKGLAEQEKDTPATVTKKKEKDKNISGSFAKSLKASVRATDTSAITTALAASTPKQLTTAEAKVEIHKEVDHEQRTPTAILLLGSAASLS